MRKIEHILDKEKGNGSSIVYFDNSRDLSFILLLYAAQMKRKLSSDLMKLKYILVHKVCI